MTLKIGIMSFAHLHAEAYIGNLRANPHAEFIGMSDDDIERGRHFARMFDAPLFASHEALLAAKPDGVLVCSENVKHRELTEMAARAGAHVLCEKPLATTVADARAMVETCKSAGVILMTAFPMRFSPPVRSALASLEGNSVYACTATNQGQLPERHRAWFVDKALAGGGAVADHTVHCADALRWMLGSEVTEVYAQANRIIHGGDLTIDTGGLVMLTFANGAYASIDCSWSKPANYPTWGGVTMQFVGDGGVVRVDGHSQNLRVTTEADNTHAWSFWGSDNNQAMIDEFVDAIREGRQPLVTGEDGLRAVEIVAAAYQSIASGQPVRLG